MKSVEVLTPSRHHGLFRIRPIRFAAGAFHLRPQTNGPRLGAAAGLDRGLDYQASEIMRSFPDVAVASSTERNRSITNDDLAQLAPAERKQVDDWKPPTLGQLAFNWWD